MAVAKDATGALLGQAAAVAATRPHAAIGEHTCHAFPQQLLEESYKNIQLTSPISLSIKTNELTLTHMASPEDRLISGQ